ncbi:DUF4123 domain-containing protein [Desulfomicrobium salsuginis]
MILHQMNADFDILVALRRQQGNIYLLMDGARFKNIHAFIYEQEERPDYIPLYRGTYFETALEVSPCLVRITNREDGLLPWYAGETEDKRKAMLLVSDLPLKDLTVHFQEYLEAKLPNYDVVLFRFYDPKIFEVIANHMNDPHVIKMLTPIKLAYWKSQENYKCLSA